LFFWKIIYLEEEGRGKVQRPRPTAQNVDDRSNWSWKTGSKKTWSEKLV